MPYAVFIPFKKIAVVKGIANQTTISKEDIAPLVEEPKLSDIEIIREHNIDKRKKLFEELKISQMKAGISNDLKYSKSPHSVPDCPKKSLHCVKLHCVRLLL